MENQPTNLSEPASSKYVELSLADIVDGLAHGKRTIALSAVVGVLLTAVLLWANREFKAEARFVPPSVADVEPLNISTAAGITTSFTPTAVFDQFLARVQSWSLHRRVFEQQGMLPRITADMSYEERAAIDENFRILESGFALRLDSVGAEQPSFARSTLLGSDPVKSANFLNGVAELAAEQVLANLKRIVNSRVLQRRAEIALVLENMRSRARADRNDKIARLAEEQAIAIDSLTQLIAIRQYSIEARNADRIVLLEEALVIAQAAGLELPLEGLAAATNMLALQATNVFGLQAMPSGNSLGEQTLPLASDSVNFNGQPLFFRGAKMLKAELDALKKRTSNDPFVKNLRSLEEELQQEQANPQLAALRARVNDDPFIEGLRELEIEDQALAAVKLPEAGLAVMVVDQEALPPRSPVYGWKYLFAGCGLGAVAGGILALLLRVLKYQQGGNSPA